MNLTKAFQGLVIICACFSAGLLLQPVIPISVPATLLGLLLLLALCVSLKRVPVSVAYASQLLLKHMSVFFVPATLSVVLYRQQLAEHGVTILLAVVGTTLVSLAVTAKFSQWLETRAGEGE